MVDPRVDPSRHPSILIPYSSSGTRRRLCRLPLPPPSRRGPTADDAWPLAGRAGAGNDAPSPSPSPVPSSSLLECELGAGTPPRQSGSGWGGLGSPSITAAAVSENCSTTCNTQRTQTRCRHTHRPAAGTHTHKDPLQAHTHTHTQTRCRHTDPLQALQPCGSFAAGLQVHTLSVHALEQGPQLVQLHLRQGVHKHIGRLLSVLLQQRLVHLETTARSAGTGSFTCDGWDDTAAAPAGR